MNDYVVLIKFGELKILKYYCNSYDDALNFYLRLWSLSLDFNEPVFSSVVLYYRNYSNSSYTILKRFGF